MLDVKTEEEKAAIEEQKKKEEEARLEEERKAAEQAAQPKGKAAPPPKGKKPPEPEPPKEEEKVEEEVKEEPPEPNDFITKCEMIPPQDPEGNETLHFDLLLKNDLLSGLMHNLLDKILTWLGDKKANYQKKVAREGKLLIDQNVDELDENLRKQWPRKGKLEVEVYQERKSQVTAHNKKYER